MSEAANGVHGPAGFVPAEVASGVMLKTMARDAWPRVKSWRFVVRWAGNSRETIVYQPSRTFHRAEAVVVARCVAMGGCFDMRPFGSVLQHEDGTTESVYPEGEEAVLVSDGAPARETRK